MITSNKILTTPIIYQFLHKVKILKQPLKNVVAEATIIKVINLLKKLLLKQDISYFFNLSHGTLIVN